ncbi:MAG: hypothetical protein LBU70_02335 [Chitinispirillales bacterium]|jgi:hypothetical protein|nr:hypothetical protein [Chitinispirillales bacterium]
MSIRKKLVVAGVAVLMVVSAAMAELKVTPYGAAQYRLRFQHNSFDNEQYDAENDRNVSQAPGTFDYTHRLSYRMGVRATFDDQFSAQFQIGNDWNASENVNWTSNNGPSGRANADRQLYLHLAYGRWNPGFMFIEAGKVPLSSNGTLDLLYARQTTGSYESAAFNGWGDMNNSAVGLKVGVPILQDDFKLGVELFHSMLNPRSFTGSIDAETTERDIEQNPRPHEMLFVLTVPMQSGPLRITPEFTFITSREYANDSTGGVDHEMLFGANASYKVNDGVTVNANVGYGMMSNSGTRDETEIAGVAIEPKMGFNGLLIGVGTSIKAGPGTLQLAFNYANTTEWIDVTGIDDITTSYTYGDIRYAFKLHDRVTFTPRYRFYLYGFPEETVGNQAGNISAHTHSRFDNRFELTLDMSF